MTTKDLKEAFAKAQQKLDKHLLDLFAFEDTYLCYKIENNKIDIHYVNLPRFSKEYPDGYKPITKNSYDEISQYLNGKYLFLKPIADNFQTNMFNKGLRGEDAAIEMFKHALPQYSTEVLKNLKCTIIPKKARLRDYQDLFEYSNAEKLSGKEIATVLKNIPLSDYYFDTVSKAFNKAFSYFEKMENISENSGIKDDNIKNIELLMLSKKEELVKGFIEKNASFISKAPNRVWFGNMISKLDSNLNIKALLNEEDNIELFEEDTWKHATVELSKHGLYKNYPMDTSVSSYNAQNAYKSALSQFSTFIASNDSKLNWGLNIEQAHLGLKKNGNYLFSLAHSTNEPDKEKFQKLLKSFLDYIAPQLLEEKDGFKISRTISEIFDDKDKLRKIVGSVVLFNDMSDNLSQNEGNKRKSKI